MGREAQAWLTEAADTMPDPELTLWIARSAVHALVHLAIVQRPRDLARPELVDELTRLVTGYLRQPRRRDAPSRPRPRSRR